MTGPDKYFKNTCLDLYIVQIYWSFFIFFFLIIMILNDLLGSDGYTPVNKKIAKEFGFITSGYFGELIRQRKRFGLLEFSFSQSQMEEEIGISEYEQRQAMKILINNGFISVKKKGMPAKYHFIINDELVLEYFKHQSLKNGSTSAVKTQAHNKNNNKNNNNILSNDRIEQSSISNEIDKMQDFIKKTVETLGLIYKKGRNERNFIKNLLTAKDFGEKCTKLEMSREKFIFSILQTAGIISFWRPINNAETIYKYYADVYNEALKIKNKKNVPVFD